MENKQSVLVIDDSPTVRRLAELVLTQEGYDVLTAEDGDGGLEIAKRELPSVIIVDFVMPKMNGFQLCKNIRSDSVLNDVPIVLMTCKGKDAADFFDEKVGIARYLQKPFETESLAKTVKEVLACRAEEAGDRPEDRIAEEEPEDAVTAVEIETQGPLMTVAAPADMIFEETEPAVTGDRTEGEGESGCGPEDSSAEESAQTVGCDTENNVPAPLQTDSMLSDIPFVDITETETGNDRIHARETPIPEGSVTEMPSAVPASAEDSLSASGDTNEEPAHTVSQDHIEREFRYYFNQELTVLLKNAMIQSLKETDLVRSSRRILSGEIMYIPVASVLQFTGTTGLSGKLTVLTGDFNSEIYLKDGEVVFAAISRQGYRSCIEELMLQDGKYRADTMLPVFSGARGNNLIAGGLLLEKGLITEDELNGYYLRLSEDAVNQTLSALTGHFYIEDTPLPLEMERITVRIPVNSLKG